MTGAGRQDPNLGISGHRQRQLSEAEAAAMEEKIRKVEVAISLVLRIGVTLSVAVIAVGLGLMFAHHPSYTSINGRFSYKTLTSRSTPFPHSIHALLRSIGHGDGRGVVVLGIFLLILTPVLRVAVGVLSFLYEKDLPMTFVTLFVLGVLVGSFFLAGL
jgi:uncharacterized membrane protein